MSNLVRVWDLKGEVHEVSTLNAHDLVTHLGWSRSGPKTEAKKAEEAPADVKAEEAAPAAEDASDEAEEAADAPKRGRPRKG